jgi:hypothetical protein
MVHQRVEAGVHFADRNVPAQAHVRAAAEAEVLFERTIEIVGVGVVPSRRSAARGRLHGYGQLLQACLQLRGEGEARQVTPIPQVAVVSSGAASFTSCLLLSRQAH